MKSLSRESFIGLSGAALLAGCTTGASKLVSPSPNVGAYARKRAAALINSNATIELMGQQNVLDIYDPATATAYSTSSLGVRQFSSLSAMWAQMALDKGLSYPTPTSTPIGGVPTGPHGTQPGDSGDPATGDCQGTAAGAPECEMPDPPIIGTVSAHPIIGEVTVYLQQTNTEWGGSFLWTNPVFWYSPVLWTYKTALNCPKTLSDAIDNAHTLATYIIDNAKNFSSAVVSAAKAIESGEAIQPSAALGFFGEVASSVEIGATLEAAGALIGGMTSFSELGKCIAEENGFQ